MGNFLTSKEAITSMRILVVDDQPVILEVIKDKLESLGSEVVTIEDSREALLQVCNQSFDAVFVDEQMPHLDGFELTRLVRTSAKNCKVPIVMLTDHDDIHTMRSAFKAGATCFLGKPITPERVQSLYNVVLGPMMAQKRKQSRMPFQTAVTCSTGSEGQKPFAVWSVNMGATGMVLDCSKTLEVGQSLMLEFSLGSGGRSFQLTAKVTKLTPPSGVDVEFIHPSVFDQEAIQHFIYYPDETGTRRISKSVEIEPPRSALQKIAADITRYAKTPGKNGKPRYQTAAFFAGLLLVTYVTYALVTHVTAPDVASARNGKLVRPRAAAFVQPLQPSAPPVELPSLTVSPAFILAPAAPGQAVSNTLTINNQSAQDLSFEVTAEDMVIQLGRLVPVPAGKTSNGIAANVFFSASTINVKPWRATTLSVFLTVPFDSPVRGVLINLHGTGKIPAAAGITLQPSLGTLITFVDPAAKGQKPPAGSLPQGSLMNYPVSQWHN